jgi:hypothetical protein
MTRQKDSRNFTTKLFHAETSGWKLFRLFMICIILIGLAVAFVTILIIIAYWIWPPNISTVSLRHPGVFDLWPFRPI